jgi:hypothetical protein
MFLLSVGCSAKQLTHFVSFLSLQTPIYSRYQPNHHFASPAFMRFFPNKTHKHTRTGLCIEPNPTYWKNLTYYRPHCQIVGAVVGDKRLAPVAFRYAAGDHGGIAGHGFDNGPRWATVSQLAYTVPLLEILQRYQAPIDIDYLSLDVEGAEPFILLNFPIQQYRIKIITGERLRGEIRVFLKKHGYAFVRRLSGWGESLWVHESIWEELDWSVLDRLLGDSVPPPTQGAAA